MGKRISLEPEAVEVCNANATPPFLFQLPPWKGREVLEHVQSTPISMYSADVRSVIVDTGRWGEIRVCIVCPECIPSPANVIFYIHGAGWVFGSFHTHEKLVRELAVRTNSVIVFPEYSRSPEARYPTAIEQCFDVLCKTPEILQEMNLSMNPCTLTVAGDSVGGNMAIAMTIMAKHCGGPFILNQLLYYPVTNACFCTDSYRKFARGYYLYREGMIWFWNQYTRSACDRREITASPLQAEIGQLKGLPAALMINGEADVLRDEGEAYARKLREACVDVTAVRMQGMIHDFVMLHSLDQTRACRAAMNLSVAWLQERVSGVPCH